jgi:hypothetical protein
LEAIYAGCPKLMNEIIPKIVLPAKEKLLSFTLFYDKLIGSQQVFSFLL